MGWAVRRSRVAREDFLELWLRIAAEDPLAADRHLDRIEAAVERLKSFPRLGRSRNDITPGLRGLVEGNTLILYRIDEEELRVELIRIVDGRRDLGALFRGR